MSGALKFHLSVSDHELLNIPVFRVSAPKGPGGFIMPELILWKDQQMDRLKNDMERLFDRLLDDFRFPLAPRSAGGMPSMEISESEDSLTVRAELPGMAPEDIELAIAGDALTIKGERKEEITDEDSAYRSVRTSRFSRQLHLPCRVKLEEIKASYKGGVLEIHLPKCGPEEFKEIKIDIQ